MLLRIIGKRNKERALPLTEPTLDHAPRGLEDPSQHQVALLQPEGHHSLFPGSTARQAFNLARALACGFDDHFTTPRASPQFRDPTPGEGGRHPPGADPAGPFKHPLNRNLHASERALAPRLAPVARRLLRRPLLTEGPAMKDDRFELADVVRRFKDRLCRPLRASDDAVPEKGAHRHRRLHDRPRWAAINIVAAIAITRSGCYHGCRNRACPACHGRQMRDWLQARQAELLPCDHYHVVATVPRRDSSSVPVGSEVHVLVADEDRRRRGYRSDPRSGGIVGATPGILMVLHTWTCPIALPSARSPVGDRRRRHRRRAIMARATGGDSCCRSRPSPS